MYSSLHRLPHSAYVAESAKACGAATPIGRPAGLAQSRGASPAVPHYSGRVLLKQGIVHNAYFKQCIVYRITKSSGIILRPWATFVPVSAFLLILFSAVARRE